MSVLSFPLNQFSARGSGGEKRGASYKSDMLALRDALREEAVAAREKCLEYSSTSDYIQMLEGRQWGNNRPQYRSNTVDNRMAKARQESIAYLTDVRPTINITCKVPEYQNQTDILHNLLSYEFRRIGFDIDILPRLIDHANFGIAYAKTGGFAPGRLTLTVCGADQVLPIQQVDGIQSSFAVLYKTYKPLHWFWQTYGMEACEGLEREARAALDNVTSGAYQRPGMIDEYTWNVMSPAMRNINKVPQYRKDITDSSFPVLEYEEYWIDDPAINESTETILVTNQYLDVESHNYWYYVKPGERIWPRKRLVIFAGDRIMYDGPSMYWHGLFPFEELVLDPLVWSPGGMSRYRNLKPLQKSINTVVGGVEDTVKKALNQAMIIKAGSVTDEAWDRFFPDRPGDKLKMTPVSQPSTDLRYGPVPELPGFVLQYLQGLYASFDKLSGGLDTQSLMKKKQMPSPDSIEAIRDQQTAPFRLESRMIERFLERLGPHAVSNIFQFFNAYQRIRILGADGITMQDFDFDPDNQLAPWSMPREHHWRNFALEVVQGSLRGDSHTTEKNVALRLFQLHAISRAALLRKLDIPPAEIDKINQELKAEAADGTALMAGKGARAPRTAGQQKGKNT